MHLLSSVYKIKLDGLYLFVQQIFVVELNERVD